MIIGSEPGSTASTSPAGTTSRTSPSTSTGSSRTAAHGSSSSTSSEYTTKHGLTGAPVQYGLLENARRGRLGLSVGRLPPQDGRTLRAVLESRCQEPVFVLAGGTFGGRDHHGHRREPDDLRPVPAATRRSRPGQSGRGGAADVGRAAARRLGVARGQVGVRAWARRQTEQDMLDRADLGVSLSAKLAVREAFGSPDIGIDDVATFDLYSCFPFPVFAVCEEFGHRRRRPARADAHRWAAVLRRSGQQLLAARHRRDRRPNAGQARTIRPRGCQRRRHEQVLGGHLLDYAGRLGGRSQRGSSAGDRRAAEGARSPEDAEWPATIETYSVRYDWPITHRGHHRPARCRRQRFMAITDDDDLVALMSDGDPIGCGDIGDVRR